MKRVVRLLGVGLLLLVVLLLILFVLAQTTPLISAQDEHAVWLRLLITAIVICLLSMCIFFLFLSGRTKPRRYHYTLNRLI